MDAVNEMYLWHGWWPQSDEDSDSRASTTGSAETRWSNDRRLAMETTKCYAEGSYSHSSTHNHVLVDVKGKQLPFPSWELFSSGNLINSALQNDTKATSCRERVLSSTAYPVPSFPIGFSWVDVRYVENVG